MGGLPPPTPRWGSAPNPVMGPSALILFLLKNALNNTFSPDSGAMDYLITRTDSLPEKKGRLFSMTLAIVFYAKFRPMQVN